jgi:hypothetical protein
MTTRMDPRRDCVFIDNTPIDYLDFASPVAGLGSKVGMDATHKWEGESEREWGTAIAMSPDVKTRVDAMWDSLGIELARQKKLTTDQSSPLRPGSGKSTSPNKARAHFFKQL